MSLKRRLGPEIQLGAGKRPKVAGPTLRLEGRSGKRDAFYSELSHKHVELDQMRKEDKLSALLREEEQTRLDRKLREFHAQPVRRYALSSSVPARLFKPTRPVPPRLHTADRALLRAAANLQ